ncbi:O-methyltransferase ZRP4 [Zea mays]|uniref:O-methyltransferase ZRP4 n=2 Tax=Zea mays TaxID=4577 RepID=A0A979HIY7_MAIZE|nr:O-methyltransferase ZRP4 [Zea mays]PWZ28670.1 O-methyltransferase ZRP4 [Zea mays]PWZ29148.1 O-methyltransferase ZRP4 [Zea mays]|eukprot:NP_001158962.1 O-methyltransferase ZRP4 [Zea mays]
MALSKEQKLTIPDQQHTTSSEQQVALDAELQLWNHTFGYVKSMALKAALDLGIPDAIHQHGGSATIPQIVTRITLHPSKTPCLRRLMRVLTLTGVFGTQEPHDDGGGCDDELVYTLTPASRLLVGPSGQNVSPLLNVMLCPILVSSFLDLRGWFQHEMPDPSPFKVTHGRDIWELAAHDAGFRRLFDAGMVADSGFIMNVVVRECGAVFQGISSLVDVGGGFGGATQAIAKAFPHLECSVLDLPNVVAGAPADTAVKYVAGDMFESVSSADAVFLKWIIHDWGDADCVKILKNCKKAIPAQGGKVIILDIVVGAGSSCDRKNVETQCLFDLYIMTINGVQRDEREWKKIIFEAGFTSYKIIPVLGTRSIIEVCP